MSSVTPTLDQLGVSHEISERPQARLRWILATALVLFASGSLLLSLQLAAGLSRFPTLHYLLAESAQEQYQQLKTLLLWTGIGFGFLAGVASWKPKLALGLTGGCLLVGGALSGWAGPDFLSEPQGLQESLLYRLRGLAAAGMIGGVFLLFLARLPGILSRPVRALERRVWEGWRWGVERFSDHPSTRWWMAGGMLVLVLMVGFGVLQDFPNSSDENSYLTQARIFAGGHFWVEAPSHPDAFRARSLIMDTESGRFFAKAFPGWAAILSLGVQAGIPWMVNPVLSVLTLVLAGWLAREMMGIRGELLTWALMGVTPFFFLNSASYFNHPATLLMMTLFLLSVFQISRGGSGNWVFLAGATTSLAFTIRPASAVALTLPFWTWMGVGWWRQRQWGRCMAGAVPVLSTLILLASYNRFLYGSVWKTGYAAYDPSDIQLSMGWDNLVISGWWLAKLALWTLPGSLAGLYFLGRGRRLRKWGREKPLEALMAGSLLLLVLLYFLLQNKGGNEYGPRYYYDGWSYLCLLMAAGWLRAPRVLAPCIGEIRARRGIGLVLAFAMLLTVTASTPFLLSYYRDKIEHNRDLFTSLEKTRLPSALVFLKTGSGRMPPGDLVRNPLDFQTGVIYARERDEAANRELASLYSDRPAFVYSYDPYARRSTLTPFLEGVRDAK